ncbi:MAG TPA: hypothetical protein VN934_07685 [Candidatus Tumulicola sp.]|nr:hypothetical protein [Candidatus Tumulicola sp.]
MNRVTVLRSMSFLVCAAALAICAVSASAGPVPIRPDGVTGGPGAATGISRPTDLVAVSTPADCPKLSSDPSVVDFCGSAMKLGYLLVHWTWTKSPCGAAKCLDEDEFHLVRKSGGASSTTNWGVYLANFAKGSWKNGDCFIVRAYNKAAPLESADSYQVCVGLTLRPVPMLVAPQASPAH